MTNNPVPVNASPMGDTAPLRNIALFSELIERVMSRYRSLPGMAVWYGFSGYGKTVSAVYGANRYRAHYIECGRSWTEKRFLEALCTELGLLTKGTTAKLVEQVTVALRLSAKPLIIDEFDHVVSRKYVETVREIHDNSGAAIILIGEELLPQKLQEWERFHNRVLDWQPAQPSDAADAAKLAAIYAPGIAIAGDLLGKIVTESGGRARRIAVNLDRVREVAALEGWSSVDAATWGKRPLFSGQPPARRAA